MPIHGHAASFIRAFSVQYWERKKLENASAGRRLLDDTVSMGEWILGVRPATNSPPWRERSLAC